MNKEEKIKIDIYIKNTVNALAQQVPPPRPPENEVEVIDASKRNDSNTHNSEEKSK